MKVLTLLRWGSVILGLGLFFAGAHRVSHSPLPKANDGAVSTAYLQKHYDLYNSGWFDSELPIDTVVIYDEVPQDLVEPGTQDMGITTVDGNHYVIYVSPKYDLVQKPALETLLHEMCHVKMLEQRRYLEDHGPRWQACMKKLAYEDAFQGIW